MGDMENGVNFNSEDQLYTNRGDKWRSGGWMTSLVTKLSGGAIRSEQTANYVLLGFAVVVFIISAIILFSTF